MDREEENKQELYAEMVNHNTILLKFGGWIQYVEGLARGLEAAKTVDSNSVLECIGEIMEYMKTLKRDLIDILSYCETVLEKEEQLTELNEKLNQQVEVLQNNLLLQCTEPEESTPKKKKKEKEEE